MTNSFRDGDAEGDAVFDGETASYHLQKSLTSSNPHSSRLVAEYASPQTMLQRARRITRDESEFPAAFLELAQPPVAVWGAGTFATANSPAVAIVGTRQATPYGMRVTRAIAATCARNGVCVVSGLARGIDGAAHEAALDAGGRTVAVLGTGIDVYFPASHRSLQERIACDGLVLTEMSPGERGHGGTFPRRNRLIAALAQLVIVVEAGVKSGTHLTVGHAQALGRRVAAVPGPIDVPQSLGANQLLRDGADVITNPSDVLDLLSIDPSPPAPALLDDDAAKLWHALESGGGDFDTLVARAGLTSRAGAAAASTLEIAGLVQFDATGRLHRLLDGNIA